MVYNNDSSSSNLKPVLLVVSIGAAILFGGMYAFYANSERATANAETSQPVVQQQAETPSQAPVTTAAKPKSRSRV